VSSRYSPVILAPDAYVLSLEPDGARPPIPDWAGATVRRYADAIGLPHVHTHSLRHFAATELIAGGIDPRRAARRLGHASPTLTLDVYAHAREDGQRAEAEIARQSVAQDIIVNPKMLP
jgi:integrase